MLAMTRERGCYSFLVIAREQRDRGDPVMRYVSRCDRLIDWIATPSAMARNDKEGAGPCAPGRQERTGGDDKK